VAAQQILQGVVKQIRALTWICSMLESVSLTVYRAFRLPCAGVMDDCPQTIGGGFHLGEGQNAFIG
jgi:hypothetical protein